MDDFAMRSAEGNAAVRAMIRAALKAYPFYGQEDQREEYLRDRMAEVAETHPEVYVPEVRLAIVEAIYYETENRLSYQEIGNLASSNEEML
jgi:hypothetical protein